MIRQMTDLLAQPAWLLQEAQHTTLPLPVRLRAINQLTFLLDGLFTEYWPQLQEQAKHDEVTSLWLRTAPDEVTRLLELGRRVLMEQILPELGALGCTLLDPQQCTPRQRQWVTEFYRASVFPLLTPLAVDAGRPFPHISANSLNLLAVMQQVHSFDLDTPFFARLKVPRSIPRLIELQPAQAGAAERHFMLSEEMVRLAIDDLFPGMSVLGVYQFRLLRVGLLSRSEVTGKRAAMARQKLWPVVRVDVETTMPDWVRGWLLQQLNATNAVVLMRTPPIGVGSLALEWADTIVDNFAGRQFV